MRRGGPRGRGGRVRLDSPCALIDELLAEREEEAGNAEQAKRYRQLAEAIAEVAAEMDP